MAGGEIVVASPVDVSPFGGAALFLHAASILPTVALGFLFLIQDGLDFGGVRKLAHAAAEGDAE